MFGGVGDFSSLHSTVVALVVSTSQHHEQQTTDGWQEQSFAVVCYMCCACQVIRQLQPPPRDLQSAAAAAAAGDILPLKMLVLDVLLAPADGSNRSANPEKDPVVTITCQLSTTGSSSSSGADSSSPDSSSSGLRAPIKVAFVLASVGAAAALPAVISAEGFSLQVYATEASLLLAWRDWVRQMDPDGFVVFQVSLMP